MIFTTAHFWCGGHSISISACESVGGKDRDSSLHEGVSHTYILRIKLEYKFYLIYKNKKIKTWFCNTMDIVVLDHHAELKCILVFSTHRLNYLIVTSSFLERNNKEVTYNLK